MGNRSIAPETWEQVKQDYINSATALSYRELGKKYDIAHNSIMAKAKKESWEEQRAKHRNEISSLYKTQINNIEKMIENSNNTVLEAELKLLDLNKEKRRLELELDAYIKAKRNEIKTLQHNINYLAGNRQFHAEAVKSNRNKIDQLKHRQMLEMKAKQNIEYYKANKEQIDLENEIKNLHAIH